jgi:hypothetical protein
MPARWRVFPDQALATGRKWPTLTDERPATNGGLAIHRSRPGLGQPLYAALLPVVAGHCAALDDPHRSLVSNETEQVRVA